MEHVRLKDLYLSSKSLLFKNKTVSFQKLFIIALSSLKNINSFALRLQLYSRFFCKKQKLMLFEVQSVEKCQCIGEKTMVEKLKFNCFKVKAVKDSKKV